MTSRSPASNLLSMSAICAWTPGSLSIILLATLYLATSLWSVLSLSFSWPAFLACSSASASATSSETLLTPHVRMTTCFPTSFT